MSLSENPQRQADYPDPAYPDATRFAAPGAQPHPILARGELVGFAYIATALKMPTASAATLARYIGNLIETQAFPLPNPRLVRGRMVITGAGVVTPRSLWNRQEVDIWFAWASRGHASRGHAPGTAAPQNSARRAAEVDDIVTRRLQLIQGGRS